MDAPTVIKPSSRTLSSRGFISLVGIHQIVCWGTLTYGVTVFSPAMAQRAGVTVASVMTVYALGLLFNGFVAPAATRWVMRGNAWHGGLAGLFAGLSACVVLAFASNLPTIALGFALAGAAMALTQYDFAWLLVRLYHPHSPRRVVTGITLFGALASSIMWPIAHALNTRVGLTLGWLGLGLIMTAVGAVCLFLVTRRAVAREHHRSNATEPAASAHGVESLEMPPNVPTAQLWALVFGLTTVSVIGAGLAINLPQLLAKAEADPVVIAGVLSLFGVGQLLARFADFLGAKKFGLDRTVLAAASCSLACWSLLLLPQSLFVTAVAVLMMGASNGLFTIVRGATPQLTFHGSQFTEASATLARWGSYGRAAAPLVVAWLLQATPALWVVALCCAVGTFAGVWAVFRGAGNALHPTQQPSPPR